MKCACAFPRLDVDNGGRRGRPRRGVRRSALKLSPVPAIVLGLVSPASAQVIPSTNEVVAPPWNAQRIFESTPQPNLTDPDSREEVAPEDTPATDTRPGGLWGVREWDFFLNDPDENHLSPGGTVALEFNEEPSIGFYTRELRKYFGSRSARIFRGRVILLSPDSPHSRLPPAGNRVAVTEAI
jgi:hypothetical protein